MYTLAVLRRKERNHSGKKGQRGSSPTERGSHHAKHRSSPAFSVVLRTTVLNPPLYNDRLTKIPLLNKYSFIVPLGHTCQPIRHQLPNPGKNKKKPLKSRFGSSRRENEGKKKKSHINHQSSSSPKQTEKRKKKKKRKKKRKISENLRVLDFYFLFSLSSEKPNPRNPAIEASPFSLSQIESELSGFRKVAAKYIL